MRYAMLVRTCQFEGPFKALQKRVSDERLPYTSVLFWCVQSLDWLVLEKSVKLDKG